MFPVSQWLRDFGPAKWLRTLHLDTRTCLMMLKGALPPTIVIAIYQSSAISNITLTIGYLSALISVLSQALLPRAKFTKIIFFDLLSTCVAASLCCLAVFCAIKAREHHAPPVPPQDAYSSDACAVSALWLIVMIWAANAIRAWKPAELQDPMVAFSVFSCVTLTRAGTFVSLSDGLEFISRLLKGFMLGFAIATGVSLLVYPITSRENVFQDVREYAAQIETVLKAQGGFIGDGFALCAGQALSSSGRDGTPAISDLPQELRKKLQAAVAGLDAIHAMLQSDLFYSKDEIAWGKLSASDLTHFGGLFRNLFLPLSGLAMLPDILDMVSSQEAQGPLDIAMNHPGEVFSRLQTEHVAAFLHSRFEECSELVNAGLQYALMKLEIIKPKQPDRHRDEETGQRLNPLSPHFPAQFEKRELEYHSRRRQLPQAFVPLGALSYEKPTDEVSDDETAAPDVDFEQDFFLVLYILQLQDNLLKATQDFVEFANSRVMDGTMARKRIILPAFTICEWLSITSKHRNSQPSHPDPEHLPPTTTWEKASSVLPLISPVLHSPESVFGFRVAAASFCVGILAYLHQTQGFFIHQRCIWAMIVIVIGMSPTSGQTLLGFVTRIVATVVSLALSLMVWYIPNQHTAGVIVFLYLANVFEYYFYITRPTLFGPSVIAIVTLNVIVGYELQMRKLGTDVGTSNGQPYYPIYLFAPYKLLAVAAGCAVSFIWVVLPYPVTSKSTLRKSLGEGLYLLARFYSCMHAAIELWMKSELGTGSVQATHSATAQDLQKTRQRVFKEGMILLTKLRTLSHFSTFEPRIGGKFPKPTYDAIIREIQRMFISMALMAQTVQSFQNPSLPSTRGNIRMEDKFANKWSSRLATIALQSADFKSHATTSLLCHLGSAVINAQPLPPYLSTGATFPLARSARQTDKDLMSIRHIRDPAFSAFATLEVLRSVVGAGLGELLSNVKSLVGELSFDVRDQGGDEGAELRALMDDL
ncbi:uncharacterized protein BDW70DRAFT_32679 [Aspergillus foveolatus]|uniref:uncharacterized protein n=1 Tax=Aspergillus foveolatus TaxID=210207 RepID=UPI003CCE03CA